MTKLRYVVQRPISPNGSTPMYYPTVARVLSFEIEEEELIRLLVISGAMFNAFILSARDILDIIGPKI